jgi:hypothetical protein
MSRWIRMRAVAVLVLLALLVGLAVWYTADLNHR